MNYVLGFGFYIHEVLLIKKNKPDWQKDRLNGLGGKIEDSDANTVTAMAREFYEEAGVYISPDQWEFVCRLTGIGWDVDVFQCSLEAQHRLQVHQTTDEELVWADIRKLPANVIPNLRWLIPMCLDNTVASCTVSVK
jgi:8-oxo-dGTP diphosphatase